MIDCRCEWVNGAVVAGCGAHYSWAREVMRPRESDSHYRGLRINHAGDYSWSVCRDYEDTRFEILRRGLESRAHAERWIDQLVETVAIEATR